MDNEQQEIDRLIIRAVYKVLDDFVADCLDEAGNPKAPSKKAIANARAYLPVWCKNSFNKKDIDKK